MEQGPCALCCCWAGWGWERRRGQQRRPLPDMYWMSCRRVINIPKEDKARERARKADVTHERTAQRPNSLPMDTQLGRD